MGDPDEDVAEYAAMLRPKTRGDCLSGENAKRPCPWITCKWHMWPVTTRGTDGIEKRLPVLPSIDDMPAEKYANSCALDVADGGPASLETVAAILGVSRQRVSEIEEKALSNLRKKSEVTTLREHAGFDSTKTPTTCGEG